jgi:hypothetical protein
MHRIAVAVSILGDYNANAVSLRRRRLSVAGFAGLTLKFEDI